MLELDFNQYAVVQDETPKAIAGLFPERRLTLVHGLQGSGKTYGVVKSLTNAGVKPIYVALEGIDGIEKMDCDFVDKGFLDVLYDHRGSYAGLEGRVVIIDTYTMLHETRIAENNDGSEAAIASRLKKMCELHGITLIVIGHTAQNAGISNTFADNRYLPRNASEELFLNRIVVAKTKRVDGQAFEYELNVIKGRGTGGSRVINNWMRG